MGNWKSIRERTGGNQMNDVITLEIVQMLKNQNEYLKDLNLIMGGILEVLHEIGKGYTI